MIIKPWINNRLKFTADIISVVVSQIYTVYSKYNICYTEQMSSLTSKELVLLLNCYTNQVICIQFTLGPYKLYVMQRFENI